MTAHCQQCNSSLVCTACASLYFLADAACHSCQSAMDNCLTCSSQNNCFICKSGFYLSPDSSACINCSDKIAQCGQCSYSQSEQSLKCQACLPEYFINGSSCLPCLQVLPFCLQCSGPLTCITCQSGYFINSTQQCVDCSTILSGCRVCISSGECSSCLIGFLLVGGLCTPCNALLDNCWQCSTLNGSTFCSRCMDSFYLDPFLNCTSCENRVQHCVSCIISSCLKCIPGFYVAGNGSCAACSSAIPNCIYCSRDVQCLICSANYWLNSLNSCESCMELSKGCLACDRLAVGVNCSQCIDGFTLISSTTLVYSCIQCNLTMAGCLSCNSATACSLCSNSTFLNEYSTCSHCSLYIPNCNTCSSASMC